MTERKGYSPLPSPPIVLANEIEKGESIKMWRK